MSGEVKKEAPAPEGVAWTLDDMRELVSDEQVRYLVSATDVAQGRVRLRDILNAIVTRSDDKPEGGAGDALEIVRDPSVEGAKRFVGVATREEAPAEAGKLDVLVTMRDHYTFALKGPWPGIATPNYALAGLFKMAGDEIEALRDQPQAREGAQPVARVSRKGNATGSLVWTDHGRASDLPDDAALFSAPIIEGRSELKREIYDNLCAADNQDIPLEDYPDRILSVVERYTHPAPDALRSVIYAATDAVLPAACDTTGNGTQARAKMQVAIADGIIAALQAEQDSKS